MLIRRSVRLARRPPAAARRANPRPIGRTGWAIYRNLGQNYWRLRPEWSREDDYMSLPVLRLGRESCLGRPEVVGLAVNSADERRGERCPGRRGAMLSGFCDRGPKAVLGTPGRARCEGCA